MKKITIAFFVLFLIALGFYFGYPPYYTDKGIEDSFFDTNYQNSDPNKNGFEELKQLNLYLEENESVLTYFSDLYKQIDFNESNIESQIIQIEKNLDKNKYNDNYKKLIDIINNLNNYYSKINEKEYIRQSDIKFRFHGMQESNRASLYYFTKEINKGNLDIAFQNFIKSLEFQIYLYNKSDIDIFGWMVSITGLAIKREFIEKILINKINGEKIDSLNSYLNQIELIGIDNMLKNQYKTTLYYIDKSPTNIYSYFFYSKKELKNLLKRYYYDTIKNNNFDLNIKLNGYNYIGRKEFINGKVDFSSYREDNSNIIHQIDELKEKLNSYKQQNNMQKKDSINNILLNKFKIQ